MRFTINKFHLHYTPICNVYINLSSNSLIFSLAMSNLLGLFSYLQSFWFLAFLLSLHKNIHISSYIAHLLLHVLNFIHELPEHVNHSFLMNTLSSQCFFFLCFVFFFSCFSIWHIFLLLKAGSAAWAVRTELNKPFLKSV